MEEEIAIVYMVAGLSSRFGGKPKGLAKIGPNNETLMEYSLSQAIPAGFNKIILVVSKSTKDSFQKKFGNEHKGIPIHYATQEFNPEKRDKPWGTLDALCCAKKFLNCPFVVCSGDDLYGSKAYEIIAKHLKENKDQATVGYKLKNVIPSEGSVNRGIFEVDENNYVSSITERLNITQNSLKSGELSEDTLCSMLFFGLQPNIINILNEALNKFKKKNANNRKIEAFLPSTLGELIKRNKIKMNAYKTSEKWMGLTNPEDEEIVKKELNKPN